MNLTLIITGMIMGYCGSVPFRLKFKKYPSKKSNNDDPRDGFLGYDGGITPFGPIYVLLSSVVGGGLGMYISNTTLDFNETSSLLMAIAMGLVFSELAIQAKQTYSR